MPFIYGWAEKSARGRRAKWLMIFSFSALGICILRLAYLQLFRGRTFQQASENNHTQVLVEHAPRGRILDRHGVVLADDQPVFVALFSAVGLKASDFQRVVSYLSPILSVSEPELEQRLQIAVRAKSMLRISDRLTRDKAFQILQIRNYLPGVSLGIEEQRYYPNEKLASHILGYVGQITEDELDRFSSSGYKTGDWIGKSGLERLYDPILHGQDGGYLIEVDARGRQIRLLRHVPPQAGRDLILTVDAELEGLAESELQKSKHPGAAVVLNVKTGEVLALASSPGYDPNQFLPLGDSQKRQQILNDVNRPLYNRAIQGQYPPGSVFKIVTSIAGLDRNLVVLSEKVDCNGSYMLGRDRRLFKCWKQPHGHGWVDFMVALSQSCDVYYYQLGLRIGPESLEDYAKLVELGKTSGLDLPSEKKGLLPYRWKKTIAQHWQGGDTLNYAIGQGALQVTVIQMANLISLVANRGFLWQPYLAAKSRWIGQPEQNLTDPKLTTHLQLHDETWTAIQKGLAEVVHSGTGIAAQLPGIAVAGKTGTAQATKTGDHAWFVAYAPVEDPRIACAVLVENGGHGGSIAAPIARVLIAKALGVTSQNANRENRVESD